MAVYIFSLILGLFFSVLEVIYLGWNWWLLLWIPLTFLACIVGVFLVFVLVIWLISLSIDMNKKYTEPTKFYMDLINLAFSYALALIGVRIHLKGEEKLPKGRFLIVSNHIAAFDPLVVILALKRTWVSFISKPENFKIPIVGKYMHRCCHLAIDRDNARNALVTINEAAELISGGVVSMGIFPEGTRSKTGQLGEFKNGAFKIAQKAKCPIVVAVISGADKIKRRAFFRTDTYLTISGVLPYEEISAKRTNEISAIVRNMMEKEQSKI